MARISCCTPSLVTSSIVILLTVITADLPRHTLTMLKHVREDDTAVDGFVLVLECKSLESCSSGLGLDYSLHTIKSVASLFADKMQLRVVTRAANTTYV